MITYLFHTYLLRKCFLKSFISILLFADLNVDSKESGHCENKLSFKEDFDSHVPTSVVQSSSEIKSTSIIETAELMKKSVFLSPTFISNNTSVIQGEIEIVGNVVEGTEVSAGLVNDENIIEKAEEVSIDMHREHISLSNVQKLSPNSSNIQENKQCDQIFNGNIKMHDLEMQTLIDDHADEAYSSDCSSSNIACSVKHDLSKSNINKINIISEEIIYPSQFYKLKNNYLPKEISFIHVPINTTIKSNNKNSVRQDDLTVDLIPNEIGNVEPAEMAGVNECNMFEENSRKEDHVSKEDFEILQNINKMDLCTVLNATESEFIMTIQNEVDPRQNLEVLPIPHKKEVIIDDQVAIDTAIVVPCHIDFVDESNLMLERKNISTHRNICYEHGDNAVIEYFEVNASFSRNHKNNEVILTNAISNENKSDMLLDKNNATPHVIEAVTEIQTSPGNQYSLMKAGSQSEYTPSDRDNCEDALDIRTDANISENNNVELQSTLQNGDADLINTDKNISFTDDRDDGQVSFRKSVKNNVMKSEGKCRRRSKSTRKTSDENKASNPIETSVISKHKQDKNNGAQGTPTGSPIVYFKHYKKQVCEKNELVENRNEQQNSKNTPDECKDNGSRESNKLDLHHMNKAAVHEDQIKEIAKYLSEFANLKKRNHFMDRNKTVGGNAVSNTKNITYSKSSIQGVEKPGGSGITNKIQNYPPTKTYERRGRQGWKNIHLSTFKGSKTSTHSIDLPDSRTTNICNEIEVCLCHDFGRLMSYDDVNSYEHIHFWNNPRMECTPDLIFSIYSEDAAPVTIDEDIKDYPIDVCDDIPYRLCWNQIKPINKKETENNVTSRVIENIRENDNENQEAEKEHMVENTMLTVNILQNCEGIPNDKDEPCAKTGQKRKRSSLVPPDNGEPPAKNKNQGTPIQLPEAKETHAYIEEQHTSTKSVKNIPVKNSPLKDSSCGSTTLFATGEHHTGACTPANDTTTEHFDPPSTSVNEVKIHCRLKTQLSTENENKPIICGVCQLSVEGDWIQHISSKHDYLAWKSGEPSLDVHDEVAVREHLNLITKTGCGLTCAKCGLTRKYVKAYLSHVRRCLGSKTDCSSELRTHEELVESSVKMKEPPADDRAGHVICGVCEESMQDSEWNEHRASRHDYLAWKCGELPLDVRDEAAVKAHLYEITKACGGLTCAKCGLTRKYVKAYLSHVRNCTGLSESQNDSAYNVSSEVILKVESSPVTEVTVANVADTNTGPIKCGVCEESVQTEDWNHHIGSRHNYLVWEHGNTPLDIYDEEAVRNHLYEISKACGGLTCSKCGLTRKYVKAYMSHIKSCSGLNQSQNDSTYNVLFDEVKLPEKSSDTKLATKIANANDMVKCALCEESMREKDWISHIASQHDYLAWKVGDTALDVQDDVAVKDHLYEITHTCGGLTCSKCGLTRKYVKAYLTHFKNCSGVDESQNTSACNTSTEKSGLDVVEFANSSTSNHKVHESLVKCGVCSQDVQETEWNTHIGFLHNYLAWKCGEESLDVADEETVQKHLVNIKKETGALTCAKCCKNVKTVKKYMRHVETCEGINSSDLKDSTLDLVVERQVEALTTTADSALVKCGVCGQYSAHADWTQHIAASHGYVAWKDGEPPLNINDEEEVRVHLRNIIIEIGTLTCQKCELPCKSVKSYLHHVKICEGIKVCETLNEETENKSALPKIEKANTFKCGVCNDVVISLLWGKHLSEMHDYLAWKEGDAPLDVDDEEEVHQHLSNCTKEFGSLYCKYCGKNRKYAKSFMEHIKACKIGGIRERAPATVVDFDDIDFASGGTCGVCEKEVEPGKWIQHTQKEHNYLAWRKGERPWNLDDFEDVNQYLYVICKRMDGLTCNKCGLVRKYVKTYLTHIKNCDVIDTSVAEGIGPSNKDENQCAMCKEVVKTKDWKTHAIENHYNITWIVGETPIDIKNVYAVERFLKEYKQIKGNLKCNACGTTRASFAGFYAHIIICRKTEEEIDMYRSLCDICNNKYLCIYKNQHAMMHRVQTLTAEAKIKPIEDKKDIIVSGKRRAAVKARSVIENYSDNMSKHSHSCKACGFGTDFKEELQKHKCEVSKDFSGDEESAAEIGSSEDESEDTDVDSNISNEVNDCGDDDDDDAELQAKKKRYRDPAPLLSKVTRIPFKVDDVNSYIRKGDEDFCKTYLTDEVLFPRWQCQHEPVLESEVTRYMPPLEHSCKFKTDSAWTTLKRFQALKDDCSTSIFVGASIVCIAWVPPRVEDMSDGASNFLAIACHNGPDCPRYQGGETPKHENLIQIWSFNKFRGLPEIVLGIAHDFGTVWSMDWCPSGARDALTAESAENASSRLGLLAVACSSGSVYIFAIPYPSTVVKNNQIVQKLKPVAELRMTMGSNRKPYQATSVSWSKQKQHNLVLVGYADGSTAYYDLHTDSPLLSAVENNVQVFHPYYDERPHNTCITGTDLYPVSGDTAGSGSGAWSAPTGAELAARAGTGAPGRARLATASLGVAFAPHACTAVISGDDAIMQASVSELVWVPPGRRLGGTRCAAGCARCGRVVASMPPTLRIMRMHPSFCDAKKQVIGMLEMTHLAKKRTKQVNDELSMTIEPLTYGDAVSKYGIAFTRIAKSDRVMQQQCSAKPKTHCPERFPLADVESMAFCPSKKFHDKLAIATHSGILFLITTN
ncbi:uncharacterized protein LOC134648251 [Cydia amplana]|uniref:uncharacterized protein LOC134648251 n=1 Tax=Cydia amplana TaxID=1869771 RepID=UPI002FE60200